MTYGHAVTLTASVTGSGVPAGSVSFYSGAVRPQDQLGTGTLSFSDGEDRASITVNLGAASPYTLIAVYGGDSNDQSSTSSAFEQTVKPAPLAIIAASQTKVYGQANPDPAVSYMGFVNGNNVESLAEGPSVTTTATTASPVGAYPITAAGTIDPNYTITYVPGTLTVNQDATETTATASRGTGALGKTFTLIVTVTADWPGSGMPSGAVDFVDASTGVELGRVALSNGTASLSITALAPGPHSINVSYSGGNNFLASSTTTRTITVNPSIIVLDPTARGPSASLGAQESNLPAVSMSIPVHRGRSEPAVTPGSPHR